MFSLNYLKRIQSHVNMYLISRAKRLGQVRNWRRSAYKGPSYLPLIVENELYLFTEQPRGFMIDVIDFKLTHKS